MALIFQFSDFYPLKWPSQAKTQVIVPGPQLWSQGGFFWLEYFIGACSSMPCNSIAYLYSLVVTRLTVSLDRGMRGVVFPSFFDFGSKFCVTNLQYCNFFFTYLIKLDLPHSLITKSVKVITKNMHKTLCVAQNIGSLIRGRQYYTNFIPNKKVTIYI